MGNIGIVNPNRINVGQGGGLKGRPVSSFDEVRATSIDFDGSIFYFPDLTNQRIYTKQINVDGTASLRVYELSEQPLVAPSQNTQLPIDNLVTKEEFQKTINSLASEISNLKAAPSNAQVQTSNEKVNQQPAQPKEKIEYGF